MNGPTSSNLSSASLLTWHAIRALAPRSNARSRCAYIGAMTDDKSRRSRPHHHDHQHKRWFDRFSSAVTRAAGSSYAFLLAITVVLVWAVSGPIFAFSDTWQL